MASFGRCSCSENSPDFSASGAFDCSGDKPNKGARVVQPVKAQGDMIVPNLHLEWWLRTRPDRGACNWGQGRFDLTHNCGSHLVITVDSVDYGFAFAMEIVQ